VTWTYVDSLVMSCRARRPQPQPPAPARPPAASAGPADLFQAVVEAITPGDETMS